MKPGDVYVGVIDFFSSVIPGAIAAFMLMTSGWIVRPQAWPRLEWGSPTGWVVFLVAAYLLGQLLSALASVPLDYLYDRAYAKWKRARSEYERGLRRRPQLRERFRQCLTDVINAADRRDGLLIAAETLKRQQLTALARDAVLRPDDIGDTFRWAEAVARTKSSEGAVQAESLMAQSKLFRAVTLLVLLGALWLGRLELTVLGIEALLFLLCLWRFLKLRWDATKVIYEHFILASLLEPRLAGLNIVRNLVPRAAVPRPRSWIQRMWGALRNP